MATESMHSILEQQRSQHVALDLLTSTLTALLASLPGQRTHRERLATAHRASFILDRIADRSNSIRNDFEVTSAERTAELDVIGGRGSSGDAMKEFYSRLAKLKEVHRKRPLDAGKGGEEEAREEAVDYAALEGPGVVEGRDCASRQVHALTPQSSIDCSAARKA